MQAFLKAKQAVKLAKLKVQKDIKQIRLAEVKLKRLAQQAPAPAPQAPGTPPPPPAQAPASPAAAAPAPTQGLTEKQCQQQGMKPTGTGPSGHAVAFTDPKGQVYTGKSMGAGMYQYFKQA